MESSSPNEIVCPFSTEWKFKKADLINLKDTKNGYIDGKTFYAVNIHGLQYQIKIFPNGIHDGTWILLFVTNPTTKTITANYTGIIESAGYSENFDKVLEESLENRHLALIFFCKTSDFFDSNNKYFIDGEITVKVEGTFKVERPLISKTSYPISLHWKIKKDDLKAAKKSNQTLKNGGNIAKAVIQLNVFEVKDKNIEAVFDFSVDSARYNFGTKYTFKTSEKVGPSLCLTDDLFDPSKGYIVEGFLTININGIFLVEKNNLDTVLNCKNNGIPSGIIEKQKDFVHKGVLMNASPAFIGMFQSGMKETIQNKMEIKGFSFEIVEAAINLLYNCKNVPKNFTLEDMLSLYQFADKYLITFIMESVENNLIKNLSPSNVCQLLNFAKPDSSNVKKLYQSCIDLLIKCSNEHTPVYGLQILDKDLVFEMFLTTFRRDIA